MNTADVQPGLYGGQGTWSESPPWWCSPLWHEVRREMLVPLAVLLAFCVWRWNKRGTW